MKRFFYTSNGCIGWIQATIRFDISHDYSRISQHNASPCKGALKALKDVFRYLKGTKNFAIGCSIYCEENRFEFSTDSNHGGNKEAQNKRRNQLGHMARQNQALILWKSTNSTYSAKSNDTMTSQGATISVGEGEICALSNGLADFMHHKYVIDEMHLSGYPMPIPIGTDSSVAISFAKGTNIRSKLKHIDQRQEWVKHMRDESQVKTYHLPGPENPSDIHTKIQKIEDFVKCRDMSCLWK